MKLYRRFPLVTVVYFISEFEHSTSKSKILKRKMCEVLMRNAYYDYKLCVANVTLPRPGMTWGRECGNIHKRSTVLCHACCADGGCNYGSCENINGYSLLLSPQNQLRCRSCSGARDLSDCNHLAVCDKTLEDCYLDEIVTDQRTVVFNGGCRAKSTCARTSSSSSVGRKRQTVTCSRCCNNEDDCNKRLCGIKSHSSECYICDHRNSEQSEVKDPTKCVTLGQCQQNRMCYATQSDVGGVDTFFYGCMDKLRCQVMMRIAYDDYKLCVANITLPPPGSTWEYICGGITKRSTSLCHACCADGGCNYGSCRSINERNFKLALQGKFDMNTLKRTS